MMEGDRVSSPPAMSHLSLLCRAIVKASSASCHWVFAVITGVGPPLWAGWCRGQSSRFMAVVLPARRLVGRMSVGSVPSGAAAPPADGWLVGDSGRSPPVVVRLEPG
jgi:hypothetical protein